MKRPLAAALAALVAASTAIPSSPAVAGPGDGSLTVKVVRDVNGNGTYEAALEIGVAGASVLVTDPNGGTATGTTSAAGTVTLNLASVTGGKYRVQVNPPAGSVLQPAPAGATLESNTMFVDVSGGKTVNVTTGLWNPADYCQNDPKLATACQRDITTFNDDPASRSLVTYPWTARGTQAATQLASQGATGTVYGLAYQRDQKRLFSAAFAKRLAKYGPGGPGAIYVTPAAGGATTQFATVPNAGATAHAMGTNFDGPFFGVPGKQSLGDIDLSEDGTQLYVVNMNDKKLYVFNAAGATGGAPTASYDIPAAACANPADWRPGALGVRDGTVWVGGVCSGQTSNSINDVRAVVYPFTGGAFGPAAVNKVLNFPRGEAFMGVQGANVWHPWTDKWDPNSKPHSSAGFDPNSENIAWPMPMLMDIGVETNGDLALAFRDRWGDQVGQQTPAPDGSSKGTTWNAIIGGDLNRVCRSAAGVFSWEGSGGCPNNRPTEPLGGGEPDNVIEYYPGEYYDTYSENNGTGNGNVRHAETIEGGIAVVHGEERMPANVMDPIRVRSAGTGWFDRKTGQMQTRDRSQSYQITDDTKEGWGKANGLGDLEALCDLAPVQIGNRVWFDTDLDGIQDGNEPAVAGVKVTATPCAGGAALPVKTTNAKGEYYFGTADGLKPETCYNLTFDYSGVNTSALPGAPPIADLKWTVKEAGPDRVIDSNVDIDGKASVTTGKPGTANHTIDAGLIAKPSNKLGDYVWSDTNKNGIQDTGEPPVPGVTVTLKDGNGNPVGSPKLTDAQGKYLFDKLDDGTYQVCFDVSTATAPYNGYGYTIKDAPSDDGKDSDVDPATKCTPPTTLGPNKREDLTLDAGLVPPNYKLGDYVWVDLNRNGVQDDGEPPVPGMTVTLKDGSGNPVGQPKQTDAQGKYLFDQLPGGTYQVCFDFKNMPAEFVGYLPTRPDAGGDDAKDSDADPTTGCTPPTSLGPNKPEDLTLDAGIRPPNKLGDYVWIDTNKNGLQDDGEPPVPGVTVKLSDGKTTVTDAQGKYVFDKLPDGDYTVCFDIANMPDAVKDYQVTKPNAGDDGKDSDADPATGCAPKTTLNIDKPEDMTIDMGLISPVNRLGDYVWIDLNKNGLQDTGEPPVEGVTANLQDAAGKVLGTTKTDAQGKYLFDNLADGTYKVCFDIKALPAAVADYTVTTKDAPSDDAKDSDADPATGCTATTTLGVGKREDLTLDMGLVAPPNKLGDYVWLDSNRNGIQDPGEPGVPGMKVVLQKEDGTPVGDPKTTDAQGKYVFDNLPDGKYKVCFGPMPADYADYQFTKPDAGEDGVDSDVAPATGCTPVVELGPGKRENLTLDAGISAPVNRLGDYVWIDANSNGLQDAGEKPVEGVTVQLNTGATTKTDAQGLYLFSDLPDGTYHVCFDIKALPAAVADYTLTKKDAGDNGKDSDADPATGCTEPVTLGVGKRENLTLDAGLVAPPNRIGDLVWFDKNRNGIQDPDEPGVPGVPVKLIDGSGKPVGDPVKTDKDGRYEFPNIPDGTYKVCFEMSALPAEYAGYQATKPNAGDDGKDSDVDPATGCTPPVTIGVGKRENRTLDLGIVSPTNRLGDFVWYDDNSNGIQDPGEPGVPNLPVYLQDGNGKPVASTKTDKDGKYLFTDLLDGDYKVCFNADPKTGLVAGRKLTKPNAGDDAKDSDADPASGCTHVTKLGPNRRQDLTLDAGLLPKPPLATTGASVWGLLGAGLALLLGGAALVLFGRKRRHVS